MAGRAHRAGVKADGRRRRGAGLERNRLQPKAIVDPKEEPDEMNGIPLSRAVSPDSRWAYTLCQGTGTKMFVHALDTRDAKAACIDLDDPALARGKVYELRLAIAAGPPFGERLDMPPTESA
jgi:hypothetical protein